MHSFIDHDNKIDEVDELDIVNVQTRNSTANPLGNEHMQPNEEEEGAGGAAGGFGVEGHVDAQNISLGVADPEMLKQGAKNDQLMNQYSFKEKHIVVVNDMSSSSSNSHKLSEKDGFNEMHNASFHSGGAKHSTDAFFDQFNEELSLALKAIEVPISNQMADLSISMI